MKLPRDLSGEEVCRALKRLGFEFVRQTGSHGHYAKAGLHPCVPMHRAIKPKTLQSILKQANLTLQELMENLRESKYDPALCAFKTWLGAIKSVGQSLRLARFGEVCAHDSPHPRSPSPLDGEGAGGEVDAGRTHHFGR